MEKKIVRGALSHFRRRKGVRFLPTPGPVTRSWRDRWSRIVQVVNTCTRDGDKVQHLRTDTLPSPADIHDDLFCRLVSRLRSTRSIKVWYRKFYRVFCVVCSLLSEYTELRLDFYVRKQFVDRSTIWQFLHVQLHVSHVHLICVNFRGLKTTWKRRKRWNCAVNVFNHARRICLQSGNFYNT